MFSADRIRNILNTEDPEGLLEAGAPDDEYDSEAEMIASALADLNPEQENEDNLVGIISAIWMKNFNHTEQEILQRKRAFYRIAGEIRKLQ